MLQSKIIGLLALLLGAVACEPLPVYPPDGRREGSRRNAPEYRDQRPEVRDDRDYRNPRDNRDRDPLGEYDNREPAPTRSSYPTAERTDNPNRVISPYAPYNVIDVEGFRSGQLAKDPSNSKIFRIP